MCSYTMVAASGSEVLSFPHVKLHSLSNEDQPIIFTSQQTLQSHHHCIQWLWKHKYYRCHKYVCSREDIVVHLIMCTHPFLVATFDVVGVSVNTSSPMGLVCLFNTGSLARGCLVYLTDTDTGLEYCRVVWRSLDTPDNMSVCPSSNGSLCTGVYSVEVYDIERDGSVSSVPALAGEIVTVFGPSPVNGPSVEDGHRVTSCELSTHYGPSVMQEPSPKYGSPSIFCKEELLMLMI